MLLKVNNIDLFYEKTGQGRPILLLHGNGESHKIFMTLSQKLSEYYTVYAIDSRGHGKSCKVKQLDYDSMAEDIVGLIRALNIEKPVIYGFSDGGILGILIAIRYPDLLSKLIISGANTCPEGIKKATLRIFRLIYFVTRNFKIKMMLTQPNIKDDDLNKITVKTLVLAGKKDCIDEKHTIHMAECIPNSTLRILEGESHESYVLDNHKLYQIILPFLEDK